MGIECVVNCIFFTVAGLLIGWAIRGMIEDDKEV